MDQELTQLESNVKWAMENCFVPALHEVLSQSNPEKYKQWAGNACKQTAVYGAAILDTIMPDYKWSAWEGHFDDVLNGKPVKYNHAWIYGVQKNSGRRLLIDMARDYRERLFIVVSGNRYPKDHPEYINMVELRREKLDYSTMIRSEVEYFTSRPGFEVLKEILHKGAQRETEAGKNGTRPY